MSNAIAGASRGANPLVDLLLVVGTGMMGGSVAAAARKHGVAARIIGVDGRASADAIAMGIIDQAFDSIPPAIDHMARASKIAVVIASPVKTFSEIFSQLSAVHDRVPLQWVTDIGSTKAGVIKAAGALGDLLPRFVSSHPMAGSEQQGAKAANPSLFEGARVLVSRLSTSDQEAIDSVEEFWLALGADPTPLPIDDHDVLLAAISHLPHVLAYSLAGSLAQGHLAGAAQALHGGGLRDTTRVAASSPELWADIFLDNREALLQSWGDWSLQVQALRQAIEANDRELLLELLSQAAQWRKGLQ